MIKSKFSLTLGICFSVFNILNTNLLLSQSNINPEEGENVVINNDDNLNEDKLNDEYLIDTGDILEIIVDDVEELSNTYQVLNDGTINLPLVGKIYLRDLSLKQTEERIKKHLSKQLIYPIIFLSIVKSRPIKYTVIGEVNNPGLYTSRTKETDPFPTIVDGIRNAGGVTEDGNLTGVKLIRKLPGKDSGYKKANLNLIDLITKGNHSQNPYLFDGDTIKILKVKDSDKVDNKFIVASNNLSPQEIKITVIGAVYNPGKMTVKSPITLNEAVLKAGGPKNWKSNKGNVQLLRLNSNGSASLKKFKINLNNDYSNNKNPILANNDTIKVNKSALGNVSEGLRAIGEPFRDILSIYSIFKIIED